MDLIVRIVLAHTNPHLINILSRLYAKLFLELFEVAWVFQLY